MHVIGNGCEAVFDLQCPVGPPMLRENYGFGAAQLKRIAAALTVRVQGLCGKWSEVHEQG